MSLDVAFTVYDLPRPQGSKRHVGNGIMVESGGKGLVSWREAVKQAALTALPLDHRPHDGPVKLWVRFYLPRPTGHFGSGRNSGMLKDSAPLFPAVTPDLDKILRSAMDALTAAGVWRDDSRVVKIAAEKLYCHPLNWPTPGARFIIQEATQ